MARDDCPDCEATMAVSEPDRLEYTAWAFDNQDRLLSALADADASSAFRRFVQTVGRGERHSVLMTLFRHHASASASAEEAHAPTPEECRDAYQRGGGFFQKLWDGHIADAYCHADGTNRPLMEEEFSKEEIIETGLTSDGPFRDREYLTNLIGEKWDR